MNTQQLIDKAIQASLLAGAKILQVYSSADFNVEFKGDQSPITLADRMAHEQIIQTLKSTKLPVLSEEGIHLSFQERKKWELFWLVDPLDGTKEFIKRNGDFTVNIALIEKNYAIAGVIYVPVTGELFVGIAGIGAWKIINPSSECSFASLKLSGTQLPLKTNSHDFTVAASRSHINIETEAYIEELRKKHSSIKLLNRGSSLKICMVAEGTVDVYPRFGPTMEWDTAAGHAIVKAAGKNIFHTDKNEELTYNKENLLNPFFIVG